MNLNESKPWLQNHLLEHAQLLIYSFHYWTGDKLILLPSDNLSSDNLPDDNILMEAANLLFNSELVIVSHGTQSDPILNYGNQKALNLWKMDWQTFISTPSRYTAEPMQRSERAQLLVQAKSHGYINNYRGIRIASNGDRFYINQAIIWNVVDAEGKLWGQAATFQDWETI